MENPCFEPQPAVTSQDSATEEISVAVPVSMPHPKAPDWIKSAVQRFRKEQFSRYELGEIQKPYEAPVWLTRPDPLPPPLRLRYRQPPNPLTMAARRWYQEWLRRDWEHTRAFFKVQRVDADPAQQIIRPL